MKKLIHLIRQSLSGAEYDYTQGSLNRAVILLAVPMILELSLESVFAIVDIFFVGKLGENAIATVGLTESVITILYSMAIGLSTAATAMVARRVGEKDYEAASHTSAQSLLIGLACVFITSIVGAVFAPNILAWMGAKPEVIQEGSVFTRIMFAGSLGIFLLFLINGIFRGAGHAAIAMKSLWLASGLNIVLCPLFIYGFGYGLKGAALATTIGRLSGVAYQCYHLFKGKNKLRLQLSHFKTDWPVITSLIRIAWPATFQFIIASASWIFITRIVADLGGTHASAGYQIAIRNVIFFILPAWGLSNAAAALVGQNLGAKLPDRAEKAVMLCMKYNVVFMLFVTVLFTVFPHYVIQLFSKNEEVVDIGSNALRIIGSGYIFYGIGMVTVQALNGAGDTKTPTWMNVICFWVIQIPLAYALAYGTSWKTSGAIASVPIAETLIAVCGLYYFRKGKWKEVQV